MNKFRNFFATRTVFFYFLFFILFPISVRAGREDEEEEVYSNKVVFGMPRGGMENLSYWSDAFMGGSDEFDDPDTDSIGAEGLAALVDVITGGRGNKNFGSEDVKEREGYYCYDAKMYTVACI